MKLWILAAALAVAACGQPMPTVVVDSGTPVVPDAGTPPVVPVPHFDADALPPGAALFTKADVSDPKAPKVEVWAQGLGPVLGLAFHLTVDGAQLRVDSAGAEPVLGLDARYLQKVRGGDVAFGFARLAGETALMAPTRVAILQLTPLSTVDAVVRLERVVARKADGTYVPLKSAGGKVVLP